MSVVPFSVVPFFKDADANTGIHTSMEVTEESVSVMLLSAEVTEHLRMNVGILSCSTSSSGTEDESKSLSITDMLYTTYWIGGSDILRSAALGSSPGRCAQSGITARALPSG